MKAKYLLWATFCVYILCAYIAIGSDIKQQGFASVNISRKLEETNTNTEKLDLNLDSAKSSEELNSNVENSKQTSSEEQTKSVTQELSGPSTSSSSEKESTKETIKDSLKESTKDSTSTTSKESTKDSFKDTISEEEIKKEIQYNKVSRLSSKTYGGRWKIDDPNDKTRIYQQLTSISGVDKVNIEFYRLPFNTPTIRIINIMYDGEYRDRVIYEKISLSDFEITNIQNEGIKISQKKANIEVSYGRLYSIFSDHNCYVDVSLDFITNQPGDEVKLNLTISSDGACFPKTTKIDAKSPDIAKISQRRVINYVVILNILLMVYCFVINKQCNEAEQNHPIASRISMIMLSWNTIWNFCLFNIHLSYALQLQDYGYFAIPACMYFILCFIFELKLLLVCWKAKNIAMFNQGNEAVRRALITFYIKFYLVALISLLTVEKIVCTPILLFFLCGSSLIPQIIENAINKSKNTPNISFATFMMITQCFFAIYIRGCPSNVMQLESDLNWSIYFILFISAQIAILYLQRKYGSRFFIPKVCRFWKEFNYYKKFSEDLEEGSNQDGGATCCICLNPLSFDEESTQNRSHEIDPNGENRSRKYMCTPCGHKYHPNCLKSWMRRKLECPFCRATIPPLDEEDEELN